MLKRLIAAFIAILFGTTTYTILKKDRVILELQSDINRLSSYDHVREIFRDGYWAGYERGWLDRNMGKDMQTRKH